MQKNAEKNLSRKLSKVNQTIHRVENLFNFSEPAGRLDFFCVLFFGFIMFYPLAYLLLLISSFLDNQTLFENLIKIYAILYLIFYVFISLANISRRMKDLDLIKPAWWLLVFLPFVNLIFLMYLLFYPGKNRNYETL